MSRALVLGALLLAAAAPSAPPIPAPNAADRLLALLKTAPTAQEADAIEMKLQQAFQDQATAAVQILLDQAGQRAAAGKLNDALADADAAITLQPDAAEAWRRRAEINFTLGDDRAAFADLAQALTRQPRMVSAWADLSRFAEQRHDYKRALAAWHKLLDLDPKTDGGQKRRERLQHLLNGEPI